VITALASPGARGRWLFSTPQLGPAGSLLASLAEGRHAQPSQLARRLLEAAVPLEQAWLSGLAGGGEFEGEGVGRSETVRLVLEELGWQVSEETWKETLELRLDAALLQRWFGVGAAYRRQLEEGLDPQRAADLESLFGGHLGIVLPQPMNHRLLRSRLERQGPRGAKATSRSLRERKRQAGAPPTS